MREIKAFETEDGEVFKIKGRAFEHEKKEKLKRDIYDLIVEKQGSEIKNIVNRYLKEG